MSVWDDLVGQGRVEEQLVAAARAARGVVAGTAGPAEATAMTHAWLFTGPPGSGRTAAARAFAAALQCTSPDLELGGVPGCGFCDGCHTALGGSHADVRLVQVEKLSIGVGETREMVRGASMFPSGGRWQVIVVEDADRLTEAAANAVLKAVEEPAPRTVWLLCAPSVDDLLPTIRSRCRLLVLRTPDVSAVEDMLLRRDGIEPAMAAFAARASQGHIDRARRLATDPKARERREEVLRLPLRTSDLGACLAAAQRLVDAADEDAAEVSEALDARETEELRAALGAAGGAGSRMPRGTAGAMKDLEDRQKSRTKRLVRESLDLALVDLAGFYRDVLALQFGVPGQLANEEQRTVVHQLASGSAPETTLRRIDAVLDARRAIEFNVAPLLALEAMTATLRAG